MQEWYKNGKVFLWQEQTIGKNDSKNNNIIYISIQDINYIVINVIKYVQDLYTENYKCC